ncbi:MAG: hypothetical protein KME25_32805 [Symplocastrum torsivum CPER-KK1]|jgi:hypothetical protein|uniref:Uncharacterized protein n=1 Tax=Symplocastrum torsivum CPER-KK1 TaxID=450513 RepID=A0A951UDI5_9CYAN|nr:hypothetical protein [Symplocastrum torsivum CPER-KK1]
MEWYLDGYPTTLRNLSSTQVAIAMRVELVADDSKDIGYTEVDDGADSLWLLNGERDMFS